MIAEYKSVLYDTDFIDKEHKNVRLRTFCKMEGWNNKVLSTGNTLYYKDIAIDEIDSIYTARYYGKYNENEYILAYDVTTGKVRITSNNEFSGSYMVERGLYRKKIDINLIEAFIVEYTDAISEESKKHIISKSEFIELYTRTVLDIYPNNQERKVPKDVIINYLISKNKMNMNEAGKVIAKLETHKDLLFEFFEVIETDEFVDKNAIEVEGYTAKRIKETTYLTVLGAYNYLIYLRNNPKEALADLKKGLPRR